MRGFESAGEGVGWMTEVKLIQGMLEKNSSESASSPSSIEEAAFARSHASAAHGRYASNGMRQSSVQ